MTDKARAILLHYGGAMLFTGLALALRWLLDPWLEDHLPFVTFFVAVALAAWVGGLGSSLLATLLGFLLSLYFFVPPRLSFAPPPGPHLFGLAMYFMVSLAFAALGGGLHRARRRAEARRELLRVTLASIGDAVITTDADGQVTSLNDMACALTGWAQEEAGGRPLAEVFRIVNEQTRLPVENPVGRVLKCGQVVGLANHTVLIRRDGKERPIDDSAAPIRGAGGEVLGMVLVFRDVAEKRRAEEARRRLAAIVESSDDAIFSKSLDGLITSWNAGAERLYGYAAAEVLGKPFSILVPPDHAEEVRDLARRLERGERLDHFETVRRRKDGNLIDMSVSYSPTKDETGHVIGTAVITRDISGLKRTERRRNARLVITQALAEATDVPEAAPRILRAVCDGMGWAVGAFWVVDQPARLLRCIEAWHPPGASVEEFVAATRGHAFGPGTSLPGRVWSSGKPLWIPDVATDERVLRRHIAAAEGLHGGFACPVTVAGDVGGVVEFFSEDIREPDPDLLEMMSTVGSQVGQFIERKRAEAALREREERYELVVAGAEAAIWDWDVPARRVVYSPRWKQLRGLADDEVTDSEEEWSKRIHPEDAERVTAAVLAHFEGRTPIFAEEYRTRHRDGRWVWIQDRGIARRDASGRVVRMAGSETDISERKRAEGELRRSEQELSDFFENATVGLHWVGPDGTVLRVNQAELDLLGYRREEYVGRHIAEFHADRPVIDDILRRLHAGEPLRDYPARMICKDGSVKDVLIDSSVLWQDGRFVHTRCFTRDVTGQRRAEQAVRESEERLRLALEAGRMGVWDWNIKTNAIKWSENLEPIHGLAPGTFGGTIEAFEKLIHPDDREPLRRAIVQSLEGRSSYDSEFRIVWPDSSVHWMAAKGKVFCGEDGQPARMVGVGMDVTERRRAELDARFLADASATLAGLVDDESTLGKVARLAVPSFADWCAIDMLEDGSALRRLAVAHVDPAKVELARDLHRRYPPDPAAAHGTWVVLRTGTSEIMPHITDEVLTANIKDSERLHIMRKLGLKSYMGVPLVVRGKVIGVITFIAAESGRRYDARDLAVAEDLAHRAGVAVENARLYQALRDADRRKDEFLALLGHELRNPLAPLRNALHVLKLPGADAATAERARQMMERQVEHLVRLVDDLLDVSRIMRGKVELRRESVELATVVARAVETAQPVIDAEGHELVMGMVSEPLWVDGDLVRLAQVVANLLNNAARYTERGGKIALSTAREGWQAVLRVRDTGIGISPEMLPRIFDMFVQAERRTKNAQGGLGIGLSLVRGLVELHGGSVEAHSTGPGTGSEFVVRLPLLARGEDQGDRGERGRTGAPVRLAPRRILVVDDSTDAADSLALMLRLEGQDVRVAYDGPSAVEQAETGPPDIIFLDLGMPKMDGYEVARRLRAHPALKSVVLVALTGWGQPEDRQRTQETGFDHHLVKPVAPEVLNRLLAERA